MIIYFECSIPTFFLYVYFQQMLDRNEKLYWTKNVHNIKSNKVEHLCKAKQVINKKDIDYLLNEVIWSDNLRYLHILLCK